MLLKRYLFQVCLISFLYFLRRKKINTKAKKSCQKVAIITIIFVKTLIFLLTSSIIHAVNINNIIDDPNTPKALYKKGS